MRCPVLRGAMLLPGRSAAAQYGPAVGVGGRHCPMFSLCAVRYCDMYCPVLMCAVRCCDMHCLVLKICVVRYCNSISASVSLFPQALATQCPVLRSGMLLPGGAGEGRRGAGADR
eukprot:531973-Rhodomonas_salina.2